MGRTVAAPPSTAGRFDEARGTLHRQGLNVIDVREQPDFEPTIFGVYSSSFDAARAIMNAAPAHSICIAG